MSCTAISSYFPRPLLPLAELFLSPVCVSADAATLFAALLLLGLLRIFAACDATLGLVLSFFAIAILLLPELAFGGGTPSSFRDV